MNPGHLGCVDQLTVESAAEIFDPQLYRLDFPILNRIVHGKPLIYFDNANTAQRPRTVIEAVERYYTQYNANVSRAAHTLGAEATEHYEATRDQVAAWVNARSRNEIVFTSGTTMAINLVAYSWALPRLRKGDVIVLTMMEHHANIVPWQLVCERTGACIRVAPITAEGEIIWDELEQLLTPEVKLLALTHVSNVLGTINPVEKICALAKQRGIPILVDGSQALPHMRVDMQLLGCDFYVFTGHKMFGPTGTGVLWARQEHLQDMPPFFGGGEMIRNVSFEKTTFAEPPHRFEAGTPNIAGIIGLGAAVSYLEKVGVERLAVYEQSLLRYATEALSSIPGLRIFGQARNKAPVISFLIDGVHAHDLATLIDTDGVAVRSGHHCAHPLMSFFGVPATARASFCFFNTREEIDFLIKALERARALLT